MFDFFPFHAAQRFLFPFGCDECGVEPGSVVTSGAIASIVNDEVELLYAFNICIDEYAFITLDGFTLEEG